MALLTEPRLYDYKPLPVEAFKWTLRGCKELPNWFIKGSDNGTIKLINDGITLPKLSIERKNDTTFEVLQGDWIICNQFNEISKMRDNEFFKTFEI